MSEPQQAPVTYRLARPVAARLVGLVALLAAAGTVLVTVLVGLSGGSDAWVLGWFAISTVLLVTAVILARAWVVRLDPTGYAVRGVRGAGRRSAPWAEVVDASALRRRGVRCVELTLTADESTVLPVGLLDGDPDDFVRDLQTRLQTARGLRRYEPPTEA